MSRQIFAKWFDKEFPYLIGVQNTHILKRIHPNNLSIDRTGVADFSSLDGSDRWLINYGE